MNVAKYGILTGTALILSYIESLIPVFVAVPGMKLGLTNIVVIIALYLLDAKGAFLINIVRIILSFLLFGSAVSLIYSLVGGLLSFVLMFLFKKSNKLSVITVSIIGAVSHNVGQIIVAMIMLNTHSIVYYLIILWFTGIISGGLIGLIGGELVRRLKPISRS